MREEAGDGGRILDGRDELPLPAAVRATLDLDIEHALQQLRPTHAPLRTPDRQDWRAEEQLLALLETHALSGEALNAWCRERGLFAHHLTAWKAVFCVDGKSVAAGSREMRTLKDENDQLKRALSRKEKP